MAQAARTDTRVAATAPPAVTTPLEDKQNCYGNTEEQICDLVRAADLAASILEGILTTERLSSGYFGKGQDASDLVRIPDQFQERLLFAAYEVEKRAKALREHFYGEPS